MPLINLLPWRKTRLRRRARIWLGLLWLQAGLMLCLIVAIALFWRHKQQYSQDALKTAQAEQGQLTARYQQTYRAREALRRYQAQARAEALIQHDNQRNLQLFRQLASVMPESLWLTEITDRGPHLLLSGQSENYDDVMALQRALSRHATLSRVTLLHASRERSAGSPLRFSLQADWRGVAVDPQEASHD